MSEVERPYVPCNATFAWKKVFEYDNPVGNDTIVQTYEAKVSRNISMTSAYESVHNSARSTTTGSKVGMNFSITGFEIGGGGAEASYEVQSQVSVSDEIKRSISSSEETKTETTVTCYWPVNGGVKLAVYQLCFTAPGIYEEFNVFTTDNHTEVIDIPVKYFIEPKRFLSVLNVIYGNQPSQVPNDVVQMHWGEDSDINKGFGGNYVWLQAVWTTKIEEAAVNSYRFVKQGDPNPSQQDLAHGAGGSYRYLVPQLDSNVDKRIYDVKLCRTSSAIAGIPPGFDGMTTDINAGRKDDFLYLVWKLADVVLKERKMMSL